MIANFVKYLTTRMFIAFFIFLIVNFASMFILFEHMGGQRYNHDLGVVIAALSLLIPSVFFSYIGKWRYNCFLTKVREYNLLESTEKTVKLFERILQFAYSFYFFPTTTEKLLKEIYQEYSKLYMGLHAGYQAAQDIYEKTLLRFPGDTNLQNILLDIYTEKDKLSKKELGVCFSIFQHSSDNVNAIKLLSDYYVKNNVFDFDSQEILSQAINLNIPSKEKVVDFLLHKLIELRRNDDFAAEVFLTAYSSYSNKSEAVIETIIKLALDRKKKRRTDDITKKIFDIYEKLPETIRKQIEEKVLKTRQENEMAVVTSKQSLKKFFFKILDKIKAGNFYLKRIIPKIKSFADLELSFLKKHPLIIFSGLGFVSILLFSIIVLRGRENINSPLGLSNLNPGYNTYESKLPYSIQVAAFKNLPRAEKAITKLSKKGRKAYYTKTSGKDVWYRVRVGEFKTIKEAKHYAEKLLNKKLIRGYFITNFEPGFLKTNKDER